MKTVQLPEVATINMGQSPPSTSYNTIGLGLPFFQGKTDFGNLYPKIRMFCSAPNKVAEKGDILLSVRAPVGPTNVAIERACIGRGLAAIRASSRLDAWYLLYFLRFYEPQFAAASKGSTFDAITRDDLDRIELPLPPLPEQQRIAGILRRADRLRRLRRYALEMSEGYLQAVFLEMFGDPITNAMRWSRAKIADLGRVQTGNTPSRDVPAFFGEHIEWIKSDNILDDEMFVSQSREMLSEDGLKNGRSVEAGAVLMTCIAGSLSSVGDVALTNRRVAFNQQINAITPYRDVSPLFLHTLLKAAQPLVQYNASAGMKHIITKSKLEELVLIKPPFPQQEGFAAIARQHEQLRSQQREALRQAEHLFQTLLHGAFRGAV